MESNEIYLSDVGTQELVRMNKICFRAPRRTFYLDEINNMRYGQNDH